MAMHHLCRSAEELKDTGTVDVLFGTFWRLPFVYVAMFLARAASIAFFKPLFDCAGSGMFSAAACLVCTAAENGACCSWMAAGTHAFCSDIHPAEQVQHVVNLSLLLHCSAGMSWGVVLFTTFGGLRGAVSLILAQILVLDQEKKVLSSRHITAEVRCAVIATRGHSGV
jgi:NhaP-type Na+/H+ or K+/H+ antiporter